MTPYLEKESAENKNDFYQKLWPCLKGEAMAQHRELQPMCQELKSLISAPAHVYATLYETTLFRWMEFCQAMPQAMHQPKPYSLLITALETAIAALKIRRGIMLPRNSNSETTAEQEPLWTYAVFTAGLWAQLPDLQSDRTVELYRNEQEKIGNWHPLAGSLYEPQTFYKILPEPHPIAVDCIACLASGFARILPIVAFRWLSSDKKIWSSWWEIVTHTISVHNELQEVIGKILFQNKAVAELHENRPGNTPEELNSNPPIENSENNADMNPKNQDDQKQPQSVSETSLSLEPSAEEENALADIHDWIRHHCSSAGKLNGKKQFLRISSGLLIRESCLKILIKENSEYSSIDSLLKLLERYLEKESQSVFIPYPFFQDTQKEIISGIILKNQYLCEFLKNHPENQWIEN